MKTGIPFPFHVVAGFDCHQGGRKQIPTGADADGEFLGQDIFAAGKKDGAGQAENKKE